MANGDLNKEIIFLNQELKKLGASTAEIKAIQRAFNDLSGDTEALSAEMDRVRSRVAQLRSEAENISTPFADLTKILQENASQLSRQNDTLSLASKAQNTIANISRDMVADYQGLSDLSKRQLETKLDDLIVAQQQLVEQQKIAAAEVKILEGLKELNTQEEKRLEKLREVADFNAEQDVGLTGLIAKTKERLALETSINENMGVAGALVGGTGALMERLGMRSGIFNQAMDEATKKMREMAKDAGNNVTFMNKLTIATKGLSIVAEGFGKALLDPTAIGLKLLDTFFKINKQAVEISRLTGQSAFTDGMFEFEAGAASAIDRMEVLADLTKQTGMNAQNMFSKETLQGAANLKVEMGLAAGEAGNLAILAQTSGTSVSNLTDDIVGTTSAFNGANRSAVSQGQILRDIGNTSDGIRASFAGNTQELVKGAAAARRLGMSINELDSIASSLLDFESSIENELEAQLLTGKQMNLAKARELALSNDLKGLGEELMKNSSDIAEFGKMNRIQQEAQAKALGMTRDQLAKVAYNRALELGMTEDQAAAAANVNAEEMKRLTAQENFTKAIEKITTALAPILNFIGDILSMPLVPHLLIAAVAVKKLGGSLLGVLGNVGNLSGSFANLGATVGSIGKKGIDAGKGLLGFFTDVPGKLKDLKGGFKDFANVARGALTGKVKSKAGDLYDVMSPQGKMILTKGGTRLNPLEKLKEKATEDTKKLADSTKGVKPGAGEGPKGFLKGLGDGLASIGKQFGNVVKGALALGIAGLALAGSFALALRMVKDVEPATMLAFATSLGILGGSLALIGKFGGDVIKGALALGILAVSLIPAAFAFSLLEGVKSGTMFAFAGALTLLGLAAAGLGYLFPFIAAGAGALALLGVALIPAAYGFSLIQGLDMGTILSFAAGVGMLGTTAALLGLVAPLIIYGSVAIAALGASLIPLSYGFAALGDTPIESIVEKLKGLALVAPQLMLVGLGLMSIAAGLGAIAIAGIAAIPALMALSGFALVMAPLAALGGLFGEGESEDNSMAEISAKLDTLISVVSAGGNVYLDGNKVGETQVLGTYKLS